MSLDLGVIADFTSHEETKGNKFMFMVNDTDIVCLVSTGEQTIGFKDIEFQLVEFEL